MATTSNLAYVPRADLATYCASKAFLHSWLQSLRHQLRKASVEVLELSPPLRADRADRRAPGQRPARHAAGRLRRRGHGSAGKRTPSRG